MAENDVQRCLSREPSSVARLRCLRTGLGRERTAADGSYDAARFAGEAFNGAVLVAREGEVS
jgi:hypothetical protein